jgi:thioesterase domain-containing protein/acyl carrier protein
VTSSISHYGLLPDEDGVAAASTGEMTFPCSAAQKRLWFIDALQPGDPALNIALRWELRGLFDPSIIEQAFQIITGRHEILRTSFTEQDGEPVQRVAPGFKVKLAIVDLTAVDEEKRQEKAQELCQLEARRPFNTGELPLFRVTLLRLAADRALLLVTAHHLIFDGSSIRLLFNELGTVAGALAERRPLQLPDLPLQYGDYCLWQKEYLASAHLSAESVYWKAKLAGAAYFEIAPDHPRQAQRTSRGGIVALTLPPGIAGRLEQMARQHNTTIFVLACAATAAMLHRHTGKSEVVFGTQISGRDDEDLENLIGVFINNLVLRFGVSGDPAFEEFLRGVKAIVEDALIHQRMPFDRLVEVLNPPRDPLRTPLFSVNFVYLSDEREPRRYGGFELYRQSSYSTGALFDLNFSLLRWPAGWRLALEFNADLFERSTAQRLLDFLAAAFELFISNPQARLSSLVLAAWEIVPRAGGLPAAGAPVRPPSPPVAAQPSEAETKMIALWREILEVADIGPASNFFERGGHSLAAMRLVTRVAATFDVKINVAALFEAPTVRELTALVSSGKSHIRPWNIVQIQPQGSKTPVIAINNTALYYNLAREIGTDRPFTGIQLFDPDSPRQLEPRSIEEIAADYVHLVRQVRPHGPYILFGLCHAAVIAYEAAQQLKRAGEPVPLLIMADSWLPAYSDRLPFLRRLLFLFSYKSHERMHRLGLGLRQALRGQTSWPEFLVTVGWVRKSKILTLAARLGLIEEPTFEEPDWENRWFLPHLQEARSKYQPAETNSTVVVLRSDEVVTPFAAEDMGWKEFVKGRFFLHRIPGWHQAVFQGESCRLIASHLRPLLEEADGREQGVLDPRAKKSPA